jgi:hypothetical protein
MWELFEQRLEAEHYLRPAVAAEALIRRLLAAAGPDGGEAAFRAALAPLSVAELRAVHARLAGRGGGPADRDRLTAWRAIAAAALEAAGPGGGAGPLTEQDLPSVAACAPVDQRIEDTLRAVADGRARDGDLELLTAAVRDYRQVADTASVSAGGRHLIGFKIARALDGLGRAAELLGHDAAAETYFAEAADAYADIAEPRLAAAGAERSAAAAGRRVLDADGRRSQLQARLGTAPAASADRAAALAGLAELAHEHGDVAAARTWLASAVTELAQARSAVPGPAGTDRAVADWIQAIPAAGDSDPMSFLRRIAALLTLHTRVAVLRIALTPEATGTRAELDRLMEIITEMPARAQAVQDRLEAQLSAGARPRDGARRRAVASVPRPRSQPGRPGRPTAGPGAGRGR